MKINVFKKLSNFKKKKYDMNNNMKLQIHVGFDEDITD